MALKKVTSWKVWNEKKKTYVHNHIEDDWVDGDVPKPIVPDSTDQQGWKDQSWIKQYCFMRNNRVLRYSVDEIEGMMKNYVNGKLSSEEIDELWTFVVQDDELVGMLEINVGLHNLLSDNS